MGRRQFPARICGTLKKLPKVEEAVYATMNVGDAVCMLGGLYHAGGHNLTKDQKRPLHSMSFCQGYLRTEVSSTLSSS
jgi:ectoine hydroxylase-related dioxygenase (phytanoyl-CoA dioxygenase family)